MGMHAESCGPAHHMRAIAKLPAEFRGFPEYLRHDGYYATNNAKTDYNANVDLSATWNDSSATAHWRNRPAGAPFFAQFTDFTTHESQVFNAPPTVPPTQPTSECPPSCPTRTRSAPIRPTTTTSCTPGHACGRAHRRARGRRCLVDDTIIFYFGDNGGVLPFSKRFARRTRQPRALDHLVRSGTDRHLAPGRPGVTVVDAPVAGVDLPPDRTPPHRDGDPRPLPGKAFLARQAPVGASTPSGQAQSDG